MLAALLPVQAVVLGCTAERRAHAAVRGYPSLIYGSPMRIPNYRRGLRLGPPRLDDASRSGIYSITIFDNCSWAMFMFLPML